MLHEEVVGHTLVLTLDRPEARNAINRETAQALDAAMGRLEGDDDLWLAVLQHEGPVFCAGADLKEISAEGGVSTLHTPLGGFGGVVRYPRTKPMIAAVDGPAVAGGLEIVLTCDLVVASTRAAFGFPEVKRGLIAGAGGPFRLARVVGRNVAAELAMTGETMSADRAHQLGLVNRLVEPGTVREAAMELAEQIAANAPVAVRRSRELVNASFDLDETQLWALNKQLQDIVHATEDFKEGPKAFVDKRPPRWLGR